MHVPRDKREQYSQAVEYVRSRLGWSPIVLVDLGSKDGLRLCIEEGMAKSPESCPAGPSFDRAIWIASAVSLVAERLCCDVWVSYGKDKVLCHYEQIENEEMLELNPVGRAEGLIAVLSRWFLTSLEPDGATEFMEDCFSNED